MNKINRRIFLATTTLLCAYARLAAQQSEQSIPCRITEWPTPDEAFPGEGPLQKASWFQKLWAERRALFYQTRERDQNAIVFLGDSITQGWTTLEKDFDQWKVANRGISGDVTRGVLYRLQDDVLLCNPAAVVLLIGTNDLGLRGRPEPVAKNLEEIVRRLLWARPGMPVVVCKIMPRQIQFAEAIRYVNHFIEQLPDRYPSCAVCDTWSIYAQPDGSAPKDLFPDLLHPNSAGYELWAQQLKPILSKLNISKK